MHLGVNFVEMHLSFVNTIMHTIQYSISNNLNSAYVVSALTESPLTMDLA